MVQLRSVILELVYFPPIFSFTFRFKSQQISHSHTVKLSLPIIHTHPFVFIFKVIGKIIFQGTETLDSIADIKEPENINN